ncbi:MAG TPA: SDR family oxidoreductase [Nocardioidaceae bacterium]|jgi:short-subunit dehydrogenase|nr:SDR family oxidoreductase [Nocardioidaceae bacterium]
MADTIVITGASSGLGAEMARQFAARGYDLGLCARRTDRLEQLRQQLVAAHPGIRVAVEPLDVTDGTAVFRVFGRLAADLGRIDRVVVNAGLGKGAPLGTGRHDANRQTAVTNVLGALAQAEAALEIFREQQHGHLVLISSMSAMRGMPKAGTVYAATKAAVAHLGEGLRAELMDTDITVSVVYPGYIRSEMNERVRNAPFIVSTEKGVRAMVEAIEARRAKAYVPAWPWRPLGLALRLLPLSVVRRLMG